MNLVTCCYLVIDGYLRDVDPVAVHFEVRLRFGLTHGVKEVDRTPRGSDHHQPGVHRHASGLLVGGYLPQLGSEFLVFHLGLELLFKLLRYLK